MSLHSDESGCELRLPSTNLNDLNEYRKKIYQLNQLLSHLVLVLVIDVGCETFLKVWSELHVTKGIYQGDGDKDEH